jgi:diguanylate cyclase (GGDEF)-like protein/PAS domain S-box-containing protein
MPKTLSTLQRILLPLVLIGLLTLAFVAAQVFDQRMRAIDRAAQGELKELAVLLDMAESLVGERVHTSMTLLREQGLAIGAPHVVGEVDVAGRKVPNLLLGDKPQTGWFDLVDGVAEVGGGTATLFVKSGNDFVRVATNVKTGEGVRAVGTVLDPGGKAYRAIAGGSAFYGVVKILGEPYITGYEPMFDISGQLIGAWYVGYKVDVQALEQAINQWSFLQTGFAAVMGGNNRVYFVSEHTNKQAAQSVILNKPEGWVVAEQAVPAWDFRTVIAYPRKESWQKGLADAGFLAMVLGLLGTVAIGVTFWGIKRFVFGPLGGDPADATVLVQRVAGEYFTDDGARANPGTLMANVIEMRARLGQMVSTLRLNAESMALSAGVFKHAHDGIFITDSAARIIEVNPAFTEITGYGRADALGRVPWELGFASHDEAFFTRIWQEQENGGEWRGEAWNKRQDGDVYAIRLDLIVMRDEQGGQHHYVGVFSDITEAKEQQYVLERLAYHDPLTQLPNRTLFADRLEQALARSERSSELLAICYFDLDGFKPVNDKLGHEAGDRLLVELASRVRACLRETDTIARMGGDEFAVLLCDLKSMEEGEQTLNRLLARINEPFVINGTTAHVSASIGVTVFPLDDTPPDTLLRHADHAMYQAKISGGARYHLFDAEHDRLTQTNRVARNRIEEALENQEFVLYYQPKVNLHSGEIYSLEALIRWQHPQHGLRQPTEFLPQVENTDFIIALGEWVIAEALRQMEDWQAAGHQFKVSLNIAARHMMHPEFAARLAAALKQHPGIAPEQLVLEITETAAIEDIASVAQVINSCKLLGVGFALDDFGVGYSSLTYLRRLPVDIIKIDQSFVRDMLHDNDDMAVVTGIISLSRDFKRKVIAEGVESVEHGLCLMRLGCDLGQGYGIAKPMPAGDLPDWIRAYKPDSS